MNSHRSHFQDLTGQSFTRWTVKKYSHTKQKIAYYECQCDCGTVKIVNAGSLRSGRSKSCGCLMRELIILRQTTHGQTLQGTVHADYSIWGQMRSRCNSPNDPSYPDYGGRGIRVCDRWDDFSLFIEDMGPRPSTEHSIDRKDNDGDYEPDNCRWATGTEQCRNTRSNRILTYKGVSKCITEWAEEMGIAAGVLYTRIKLGWSVEKTLTTPVHSKMTKETADAIREMLKSNSGTATAKHFNVSSGTVSLIGSGKIWK